MDQWLSGSRRRACVAQLLLFALLFLAVSQPFRILLIPSAELLLGNRPRDIAEWDVRLGGEYVLPADTQDALALLRSHDVKRYWASQGIAEQRVVVGYLYEASVPSLPDSAAPDRLFYRSEPLPSGCRTVAEQGAVRLVHCD